MHQEAHPISGFDRLLAAIQAHIDESVRPRLEADGTSIELVGIDDDRIVQIRLTGSCQGCSSSMMAVTFDVERTLKSAVPEVRFVEAVL